MQRLIGSFFKLFSFILAQTPQAFRDFLGNCVGFLWFDLLRIRRRIAIENVTLAYPEMPEKERIQIARMSVYHLGRTLLDFTLFPFFTKDAIPKHFDFEGLDNFQAALDGGKGVMLLTAHIGNGDFAISALSQMGYPMNLISKEFKARWLNDLWFGMRRKLGTRFISAEKSSFEILKALKRNEAVLFVLDQYMGPPVGVRTKFFGKETGTAAGLALIAGRTGSPVLPCYTYRRADRKQVLVFEPAVPYQVLDDSLRSQNIAVMTQVYTDKIEAIVRKHPEQWMWIHRRWKEFRD